MLSRKLLLAILFALLDLAIFPVLGAQLVARGYPTRPIRMVVPITAGSAADILARMIGAEMTRSHLKNRFLG